MSNLLVEISEINNSINVTIEQPPSIELVVNSIANVTGGSSGSLIQTKEYSLSGLLFNVSQAVHGFNDLLNCFVVKQDSTPVEVVLTINNNNVTVSSNVSLNNHNLIIKGYN